MTQPEALDYRPMPSRRRVRPWLLLAGVWHFLLGALGSATASLGLITDTLEYPDERTASVFLLLIGLAFLATGAGSIAAALRRRDGLPSWSGALLAAHVMLAGGTFIPFALALVHTIMARDFYIVDPIFLSLMSLPPTTTTATAIHLHCRRVEEDARVTGSWMPARVQP
jgi:hypothetical protein